MSKTPLNMLLIMGLTILVFPVDSWKKGLLFFGIGIASIFAEWLGVNYGLIFGEYEYGMNFGPKIDGVPYLIGVNWAFLTFATAAIATKWLQNFWARIGFGAALMVVLDFFLEESAPRFDFWYWDQGYPPLQNFLGWFVLAFLFHMLFQGMKLKGNSLFSHHLYVSQLIFFVFFFFWKG
ncbi:MAG: carotenoid biosynthesis protein [Eudoraea sp.]|nr:carotenoid biosynthesis protein [Eudoraea sp.]MBT8208951.1 carotenoid biosynthesis protein [Eudoraea sp.]NNK29387.1 carotenoid biosynthesis protein [Flavobacteriaceae bacterium]